MWNKKKIILSAVGGTAAVASALAIGIPVSTAATQQSSNTSVTPSTLESKAPNTDEFTYQVDASNQSELNIKLSQLFEGKSSVSDFNGWFKNISEYSNVSISYKNNSANFENSFFEINLTPVENSYWSGGSNQVKSISVILANLNKIENQTPSLLRDAAIPENVKYSQSIEATDSQALESWLKQNFDNKNLSGFENVNVVYKEGSANFDTKSFKVVATPLDGHEWSDGTVVSKEVEVSVEITQPKPVIENDASIPATSSYSDKIQVSNDSEFNEYLNKNFAVEKLSGTFANVDVKYVSNTANLESKSFKIAATPKANHAWTDGTTTEKTITVITDVSVPVVARIPEAWTINGIGKNSYYKTYNVNELARLAYKDLSAAYPGLVYYGVDSAEPQGKININNASVIYFQITLGVKDQNAFKSFNSFENFNNYVNGGIVNYPTQTQNVKIYMFLDDAIGVNGLLTEDWLAYTPVNDSNGLPGQWVSDFLVNTSDSIAALMTKQVLADLESTYPDWNITLISDPKPISNYYGTWTYKIRFISNDGKIVKEITGYTFTRS